jgi:DNA-binding NarL/FixJ family response regulator
VASVLVVDDQVLIRAGLAALIRAAPGLDVLGEAADGQEGVAMAAAMRPDVILMDIRMPGLNGVAATERILAAAFSPLPRVLILTTFDLDEYVYAGLQAGASGFLLKHTRAADLTAAVRAVAFGEAVAAPSVTRRLIEHFVGNPASRPRDTARLDVLTPREREVLTLVARGLTNTEIATALHLSEGTVKAHVGRILSKLDLRDRIQAVITGYQTGLVHPH